MASYRSFRAARAARHREQQAARSRRIRPELAARLVVTVAGLSAAGLLALGPLLVQRAAAGLLALLVIFGWRWVEQGIARATIASFILQMRRRGAPAGGDRPSEVTAPDPQPPTPERS